MFMSGPIILSPFPLHFYDGLFIFTYKSFLSMGWVQRNFGWGPKILEGGVWARSTKSYVIEFNIIWFDLIQFNLVQSNSIEFISV